MTRPEISGERSLEFSGWIRKNLPDSKTGYCVGNLDWIFWNYKSKVLIIIEEKTHMAKVATWFSRFMNEIMAVALALSCKIKGIDFRGFHVVQFENTSPDDGKIFWDYKEIIKEEFIKRLSF